MRTDELIRALESDSGKTRATPAAIWGAAFVAATILGAIAYCDEAQDRYPLYLIDFLRLRAELHTAAGQTDEAIAIYHEILSAKAIPWAQLGLARALYLKKAYAEAEEILDGLITEHERFIAAYDLLAKLKEESGDALGARMVLKTATLRSPHRVSRLPATGRRHFCRTSCFADF